MQLAFRAGTPNSLSLAPRGDPIAWAAQLRYKRAYGRLQMQMHIRVLEPNFCFSMSPVRSGWRMRKVDGHSWTRFTASCEVAWPEPTAGSSIDVTGSELESAHSAVLSTDRRALLASLAASHRAWPGLRLAAPSLFSTSGYSVLCGLPWLLLLSFWRIVDVAGTHFLRRAGPSYNQNHPFVTLTLHGKTLSASWLLAS